jgi:hypothetical protein
VSRIYFHSQEFDDAEVRGSERAWMGVLLNDFMLGVLGDLTHAEEWLKPMLSPSHYLHAYTGQQFAQTAATALKVGMGDSALRLKEGTVEPWTVALNTGLAMGGDSLKLFARLHGQCEIHCWIESERDKKWLANIIEEGRKLGIMRANQGWESVITLLRKDGEFPVVCSYSVCEQFPNFGCLPDDHPLKQGTDGDREDRHERYYELTPEEQWTACMTGLRTSGGGLRITRKDWNDFWFGDGTSAFNLRERGTEAPEKRR